MPAASPDPHRRSEQSRRAILAATVELVGDLGYEQVSIEAIARQAGVGKQTIYRWWPSKGAVTLDALDESLDAVVDFPDTGDIVADLRTQMLGVSRLLTTRVGRVYQGLVAAAQSDPRLSRAHLDRVIEPAVLACRRRLATGVERGELRADIDLQGLIDLLYGVIYYRLLLHTRPLDDDQIDAVLEIAFSGARPGRPR
ncbi:TetR/AcrR family transcriptional regulator [Microlunatus soli]|uniref:DNA-binding transcriptional regulator, AcrR family n=1 Tax=Microlunatus soli TaxID=630515 RepID=A0A1H2A9W7_9ACTN|nr:TetR/AcrR family transcriptional regulator [Microlunatus soli]SDT42751.1 DNA-binding transcriptional regulator, AcrR family [Microlunatus soli]